MSQNRLVRSLTFMENVIEAMNNPQVFLVIETGKLIESLLLHFHGLTDVEQRQTFGDKFAELHGVDYIVRFYERVQKTGPNDLEKSELDDSLFRLCLTICDSSKHFRKDIGRVLEATCKELRTVKTSYKRNSASRYKVERILGFLSKCTRTLSVNETERVCHTPTVHGIMAEFCNKKHDIDIRCRATYALSYVSRRITDTEPAILQNIVSMLKVCAENSDHMFGDQRSAISGKELLEFIANLGQSKKNRKCLVDSDVCSIIVWFLQQKDSSENERAANCIWALADDETRWEIDRTEGLTQSLRRLKGTDNVTLKQASERALTRLVHLGFGPDSAIPGCNTRQLAVRVKHYFKLDGAYFYAAYDRCFCTTCHIVRGDESYYVRGEPRQIYVLPVGWFKFGLTLPPRAAANDALSKWHRAFHGTKESVVKDILETGTLLRPGDVAMGGDKLKERKKHFNDRRRPDNFDTKQVFLTPSIIYAGQDTYAKPFEFSAKQTYVAKVAFQVLVKPGSYLIGAQTTRTTGQIDPYFSNEELEWSVKEQSSTILCGLLVKVEGSPR